MIGHSAEGNGGLEAHIHDLTAIKLASGCRITLRQSDLP